MTSDDVMLAMIDADMRHHHLTTYYTKHLRYWRWEAIGAWTMVLVVLFWFLMHVAAEVV